MELDSCAETQRATPMTTKDQDMSEQSNELFTMDSAKQFLNELGEHVLAVAYPDELASIMNAARAPLLARIAELEDQLETERLRLAACSTAALGYFDGAIEKYISQALHDVLALRGKAERWKERAEYEYGLRQYPENMGLAVGALDVSMLKWQWTGKQAAIDAAIRGNE